MFVRARRQRGSVVPLMAASLVVAGLVAVGLGRLGGAAASRAGARAAADAAALAGAAEGEAAARELAAANGATLVDYRQEGRDTRVVVRVGRAEAASRARREDDASPRVEPG